MPKILPAYQHCTSQGKKIIRAQRFKTKRKQTSWRKHADETNLRRHYPLPLRYQVALCTDAILEATLPLVAFQPANHAVIPAAGALGAPGAFLSSRVAAGARLGLQHSPGCGACSWAQHPGLSYKISTVVKVFKNEYNFRLKTWPTWASNPLPPDSVQAIRS